MRQLTHQDLALRGLHIHDSLVPRPRAHKHNIPPLHHGAVAEIVLPVPPKPLLDYMLRFPLLAPPDPSFYPHKDFLIPLFPLYRHIPYALEAGRAPPVQRQSQVGVGGAVVPMDGPAGPHAPDKWLAGTLEWICAIGEQQRARYGWGEVYHVVGGWKKGWFGGDGKFWRLESVGCSSGGGRKGLREDVGEGDI